MARLRHEAAQRKASELREAAVDLRRTMRHDQLSQEYITGALSYVFDLERRAATIVAAEEAVDAALTSREVPELMRRAACGDEAAMVELTRHRPVSAAA